MESKRNTCVVLFFNSINLFILKNVFRNFGAQHQTIYLWYFLPLYGLIRMASFHRW